MPAPLTVSSTYHFVPNQDGVPDKDGVNWDTITTLSLIFRRPDGTSFSRNCTKTAGSWSYDSTAADLDGPGWWSRTWKGTEGGVSISLGPIGFYVETAP